jgi:hypothetical protein
LIGTPYNSAERPTPHTSDAPRLPRVLAHVHTVRQRALCALVRHSNESTRMIRKKRTSRSAR